jgi:hypothetical protein
MHGFGMSSKKLFKKLLRRRFAALLGARNHHVLTVHSGFCAPGALHLPSSLHFFKQFLKVQFVIGGLHDA